MVPLSFPRVRAPCASSAALDVLRGRALIEICCDPDSELTTMGQRCGMSTCRITRSERFDQPRGLLRARDFIGRNPGTDVFASLPCTVWCTWSFVNEATRGPAFVKRLAWRRRQSIRMVGHAESCFIDALSSGGGAHFEWPRRCLGWQRRRVRAMLSRLKLLVADFDGCRFGVEARLGLLALKPWRLATSRPELASILRTYRCTKDHEHGILSGSAATKSGHYSRLLCATSLGGIADDIKLRGVERKSRSCRGRGHALRRSRRYSRCMLLALRPSRADIWRVDALAAERDVDAGWPPTPALVETRRPAGTVTIERPSAELPADVGGDSLTDKPEYPPLYLPAAVSRMVRSSTSAVAQAWRASGAKEPRDRRDLFPLPRAKVELLPASLSPEKSDAMLDFVNLCLAGLNCLDAGGTCAAFASTRRGGPTAAQREVLTHVASRTAAMFDRLSEAEKQTSVLEALESFEPRHRSSQRGCLLRSTQICGV